MGKATDSQGQHYPRISIVTPSYNAGQHLEQTIQSVLGQNYPNLEYIIMDGGSTDGSVETIKRYADGLFYWVSQPDGGQSDALNKGFSLASGDIIAEIDSDDFYLPGTLRMVADYAIAHPVVGCIYGDLQLVDNDNRPLWLSKSMPVGDYAMVIYGGLRVPQPGSFFRREVLERVGYLDTSLYYTMDLDHFIRMAKAGVRFAYLPQLRACCRMHSKSKTHNIDGFMQEARMVTARHAPRIFENDRLNMLSLDWLRRFYRAKAFSLRMARGDALLPYRFHRMLWRRSSNPSTLAPECGCASAGEH